MQIHSAQENVSCIKQLSAHNESKKNTHMLIIQNLHNVLVVKTDAITFHISYT